MLIGTMGGSCLSRASSVRKVFQRQNNNGAAESSSRYWMSTSESLFSEEHPTEVEAGVVFQDWSFYVRTSHLSYTFDQGCHCEAIVKVHGVLPSSRFDDQFQRCDSSRSANLFRGRSKSSWRDRSRVN
ncbi:unnamed protein product [Thlaspi arvense]|uniref:Uncharacterized protein n=1 Tax=Thlaspi arvense TaxID=13288 RepID=A0AAU9RKB1_THLAR|nr:unnamed protein product [Thlaspi arvense]